MMRIKDLQGLELREPHRYIENHTSGQCFLFYILLLWQYFFFFLILMVKGEDNIQDIIKVRGLRGNTVALNHLILCSYHIFACCQ